MTKKTSQMSYEEYKNKNEDFFKKMIESNKKTFGTDVLYLDGEVLTLEKVLLKAYQDECGAEAFFEIKKAG